MTEVDVAIVGAGAAGIAAARQLAKSGRSVLLIEALGRLGGRAHTVTLRDMALDLGCGWLHSAERNPLAALAEVQGLTLDRSEGAWRREWGDADGAKALWSAYEQLHARLHSDPPASDRAGDAFGADDRLRPLIDGISSFINGVELDALSVADFLAYEDAASETNWRLPSGYGAFIAGLGGGLTVALQTAVKAISHRRAGVVVETASGAIHAAAAIVTVPTAVLAKGAIRFEPPVDEHLHAASLLPLGVADKVFLSMAKPETLPIESHVLGRFDRAATGSYYLRPFGRPIVECFLGGATARALEAQGEAATIAFVLEELRHALGEDIARGLSPLAVTHWAREPTIGGSYSHACPGHADAGAVLARPVSERLIFAGEACSAKDYSTAHGAWATGLAAADWVARAL